ncbi:MAG: glycosyltransferase [Candidatus Binatus sp.]|uniref:glycosyltransferase n=1 Tax=Candidatus Binatus sp. TaxID=2811406 RepID=UPI003BB03AC6
MTRVLHIGSGNLYGGVETFMVTLARYRGSCPALEQQFAVCFEGRLKRELLVAGATVHDLGEVRVRQPLSIWKARKRLFELIEDNQIDVVICHMAWTQALFGSAARASRVPVAMWQHMASNGRHWLELLARWSGPDLVICNSEYSAREFRGSFSSIPIEVVHYPVAAPTISYSQVDHDAARSEFTTPTDAVVVVHSSRMQEWKGHRLLMQAASRIKSNSQWILWFVGGAQRELEQSYLASLRTTAAELGIEDRVRFLGQRNDVERLLAASDIHCQPNISPEPFGITFIEALYAGIPVVTTRIGGGIEIVNDSCGVMVPPDDPNALAAALERLIADGERRRQLGSAGPARARELCDPVRQMDLLRMTLLNLCGSGRTVASPAR